MQNRSLLGLCGPGHGGHAEWAGNRWLLVNSFRYFSIKLVEKAIDMQEPANDLNKSAEQGASGEDVTVIAAQSRREALGKIGRYSAYAAPVMMAMLSKQALAS